MDPTDPNNPLNQLRDIHLPEPVSAWPPAIGWWVLALIILLALVFLITLGVRYYRRRAYRRAATKQLAEVFNRYERHSNRNQLLMETNKLLKTVAVKGYSKADVSRLSGQPWLAFLDSGLNNNSAPDTFVNGPGKWLAVAPYQSAAVSHESAAASDNNGAVSHNDEETCHEDASVGQQQTEISLFEIAALRELCQHWIKSHQ